MRIFIAHASNFDFRGKLYDPIRSSLLNEEHEFILPQEQGTEIITRDVIKEIDLFVVDASMPSTGAGIELGWASAYGKPIIGIHEKGTTPTRALRFVTHIVLEYSSADDLIEKLGVAIVRA